MKKEFESSATLGILTDNNYLVIKSLKKAAKTSN